MVKKMIKKVRNTSRFVWLHCLTLGMSALIIDWFFTANPTFIRVSLMLGVAMFLDWAKMFIKLGSHSTSRGDDRALHLQQWNNPSVIGSTANNLSNRY